MTSEKAQQIAISALQYLAGDPQELARFFSLTGLDPEQLRKLVQSPQDKRELYSAILEHFLAHEPALLTLAQSTGIKPNAIVAAHGELATTSRHLQSGEY